MFTKVRKQLSLLAEIAELRAELEEAKDTLQAIRGGEVDALVVESAEGPQIFTLQGQDAAMNRFRGKYSSRLTMPLSWQV